MSFEVVGLDLVVVLFLLFARSFVRSFVRSSLRWCTVCSLSAAVFVRSIFWQIGFYSAVRSFVRSFVRSAVISISITT